MGRSCDNELPGILGHETFLGKRTDVKRTEVNRTVQIVCSGSEDSVETDGIVEFHYDRTMIAVVSHCLRVNPPQLIFLMDPAIGEIPYST